LCRRGRKYQGKWRRLYNEELYHPFSSPNVIRVIKSRTFVGERVERCMQGSGGET